MQRQGRTAALNMLGNREKFTAVPFFWSQHYDVSINYIGHAERWDEISVDGDITARDCLLRFKREGRTLAVASIFHDLESLEAEAEMERLPSTENGITPSNPTTIRCSYSRTTPNRSLQHLGRFTTSLQDRFSSRCQPNEGSIRTLQFHPF